MAKPLAHGAASVRRFDRKVQRTMSVSTPGERTTMLKKIGFAALGAVTALALTVAAADARPGGGRSIGSRGANTQSAPPTTNTAPRTAQPIEKPGSQVAGAATARPGAAAAAPARSGFGSMLMGGLLGAGLFGLLSGSGLFSGLGSLAGILGFVLQMALIGGLVYLAMMFFRRRSQLATASAQPPTATQRQTMNFNRDGASIGGGAPALAKLNVTGDDFNSFERLLGNIQSAYGRQDRSALRALTTQEMFHHFDDELTANEAKGLANRISGVKLLQGDLSEAWGETGAEYATVAMRYSIDDTKVETASGRVVDKGEPEVTELWTFRRTPGANAMSWKLSAIQQS
jgi:predicted lipid-binding transport protein (Tim44 family)